MPEDFPTVTAAALQQDLGYGDESSVRRSVNRLRDQIVEIFDQAGWTPCDLIEDIPGFGYRFAPDAVEIMILKGTPVGRPG
ncbi:MAG: helix-turn-helix domain-containing protein [Pseudomonadota bacterium]